MSFPFEQVQNHPFFSNRSGVKSFLFQVEEEKLRAVQWHIRPTRINNVSRPCAGEEPQIIGREYLQQINGFLIKDAIVKIFWKFKKWWWWLTLWVFGNLVEVRKCGKFRQISILKYLLGLKDFVGISVASLVA